ncbi:MAG: hypothetical protein CSB55_04020 [Candidatus Cloacimonadota bacterium]|nr:MAG: hypothetical protein CSB55_04020 [Candidatus Cloacimonadota bacterium]
MLKNKSGFTLIEVLISVLIIGIAITGVYIGMIYAESSARIAYHNRSATLQASGWLDRIVYESNYLTLMQLQAKYGLYTEDIKLSEDVTGRISFDMRIINDMSTGFAIDVLVVKVNVLWEEDANDNKRMRITLMEKIL